MKKIGIITLYNGSENYGGLLQAYALQKVLERRGFEVKQINFRRVNQSTSIFQRIKGITVLEFFDKCYYTAKYLIQDFIAIIKKRKYENEYHKVEHLIKKRTNLFKIFREEIPHTVECIEDDISNIASQFDAFVVGSDQVWYPGAFTEAYYLGFAKNKLKVSYAASITLNDIERIDAAKIMPYIANIDFISVREKRAKEIISKYLNNEVTVVLDPTMLLSKSDWRCMSNSLKIIQEKYIFVYLLGIDKRNREIVKFLANLFNLKIVIIPNVHSEYNPNDSDFADIELYEVGPREFVSLIENAELIITDSFHGCVFSLIFSKEFYALKRFSDNSKFSMNSRIDNLFDILNIDNRYITVENYKNLNFEENLNYEEINLKLDVMKKESFKFLENAFKGL